METPNSEISKGEMSKNCTRIMAGSLVGNLWQVTAQDLALQ